MSFTFRGRVHNGPSGARTRRMPADLHEGSRADYLRRHELEAVAAVRGSAKLKRTFCNKLLSRTADTRNLRLAWDYLASGDGQTPGVDGLRFEDLDDSAVWGLVRALHSALLDDTYRTNRDRHLAIPKSSGQGTRTLSIPTLVDRMVQRAIVQTVQPYVDPLFDERSLGYRPGRDSYQALALVEMLINEHGLWVLLSEDLKDAFNHVPQQRLLDVVRSYIPDAGILRLIERVVLTRTGKGLRQGGNLSPLLLNLYLHHLLDRKWRRRHPNVPLLRWADDLLILCPSREEAMLAYQGLQQLIVPMGMKLKTTSEQAIYHLTQGDHVAWLGYKLFHRENELRLCLTEKAWTSLEQRFVLAHEKHGSPLRAVETINGWVDAMGPCLASTDLRQAYARIEALARARAFDEIPTLEAVSLVWHAAHRRWSRHRKAIARERGQAVASPLGKTRP